MKNEDKKVLKRKLIESIKKDENIMPTIAEVWVKEGRVEGRVETITNMISEDFSWDLIAKITGITKKEYWSWIKNNR